MCNYSPLLNTPPTENRKWHVLILDAYLAYNYVFWQTQTWRVFRKRSLLNFGWVFPWVIMFIGPCLAKFISQHFSPVFSDELVLSVKTTLCLLTHFGMFWQCIISISRFILSLFFVFLWSLLLVEKLFCLELAVKNRLPLSQMMSSPGTSVELTVLMEFYCRATWISMCLQANSRHTVVSILW